MRKENFRIKPSSWRLARTLCYTTMWLGPSLPCLAQTQAGTVNPAAFDVASIKPNQSGGRSVSMGTSHGRLTATNVTLFTLIQKGFRLKSSQISGGPGWVDTDRYDIVAKTERTDISDENLWLSLQPLLAERFNLRFHRGVKQLLVYSLVIGKGGARLKSNTSDDERYIRFTGGSGVAKLELRKISMARFAEALSGHIDRTVVDNTGLAGQHDFKLEWWQDHPGEASQSMLGDIQEGLGLAGPSIFTAVQRDLGLRLEAGKGPVVTIIIDRAEKASAN